jgi:hypothetical protein
MRQAKHDQMGQQTMRHHYVLLGLNLFVSLVIMYFVMFTMVWRFGDFFNDLNMFYMALMMATPMGALMLLMMGSMYQSKKLNVMLYIGFAFLFVLAFWGVRAQGLIGDRQFVRSMIPHHSGAILMCNRASIRDPELQQLCFGPGGIVASQTREIKQMKEILARK